MACGGLRTLLILLLTVAYSRQEFVQPLVSNGRDAQPNEVPWHAGIYRLINDTFDHLCGGTLISEKVVVTAAHCFWNPQYSRVLEGPYSVGFGKHHRGYYVRETNAQKIAVETVHLHTRFRGKMLNYANDVAVLVLTEEARVTNAVQLASVDWSKRYDARQMVNGIKGKVAGWGITETGQLSDGLKTVDLPYVDWETCYDLLDATSKAYCTVDKFCAGYTNQNISVCPGDSGGGLMFYHNATNTWYLRGVVSVAFGRDVNNTCYVQQVTGFTMVSSSLDWIKVIIDKLKVTTPPTGFPLPFTARREWSALPTDQVVDALPLPTPFVVISHTVTASCATSDRCRQIVRNIQALHRGWQWVDVGYNFLIGGDGVVYEGWGWDMAGAHTRGYNDCSIGVSFIGTYTTDKPSSVQLLALNLLLQQGTQLGKLTPDYQLIGARQVGPTESPGQALYDAIKRLPHWSADPGACPARS